MSAAAVRVVTAVTDAACEERLLRAFDGGRHGVDVVRRCVDVADLLAAAAAGTAKAALLSADLRRLDRDALVRLATTGVAVVLLVPPGDGPAERRARGLGVRHVLPADAEPAEVAARLAAAVTGAPAYDEGHPDPEPELREAPAGRVVAVWGPAGAPGRTTLAVNLAAELAGLGRPALLADADVSGGTVAQVLGLLDEYAGLAVAARLANDGALDAAALARTAREAAPGLRVLTGVRAARWSELRPAALEQVLAQACAVVPLTVVDCGSCLEDEPRHAATRTVLAVADVVVAVGSADPVSLHRLVRGLADVREVAVADPLVVVNRVRPSGPPPRDVAAALLRYAGTAPHAFVPLDQAGCDEALARGATLAEAAPASPARVAIAAVAANLAGVAPPPPPRRRRLARR